MDLTKKYRPRKFEDVIGQPVVVQTISNSIKNNKLHHAYLFVGSPGSGKTSSARILAAALNCSDSPGLYPCGKCDICKGVFSGSHTDIVEIDAASNAGSVEEIRKLKNSALYSPVDGAKIKVFIIDECLPYESVVTMEDGSQKQIGELVEENIKNKSENIVFGRDLDSGKKIGRKVLRYIKILNDKQMYEITIKDKNGIEKTIRITGNHNVFIEGQGKIKAENLKTGQKVFLEK